MRRMRPNFVPFAVCVLVVASLESQTTLGNDISAHASMKNVAKCDTWCELQNPVNHRVFERKLRPKPSGRGATPAWASRIASPQPCIPYRDTWHRGGDWIPLVTASEPGSAQLEKSDGLAVRIVVGEASSAADRAQVPWKGAPERVRAPSCPDPVAPRGAVCESGCLGMQQPNRAVNSVQG
ncbi:hypothetical protein L1887_45933 [Cichorium endivia]|nr:hypothetical protein L1887_45933 [Cichorium endivia]